jgi:Kef-type K+ transport system membrane component KefB
MLFLARFLLQLALTIVASRLVAKVLRMLGQSAVIAEVVAGILLGPTLLGAVSPQTFQWLFPPESIGLIKVFAQIGIALFMFGVGMEFDAAAVRSKGRSAIVISMVSIAVPFVLGLLIATPLAQAFGGGKSSLVFSLFIATAMSITAFPVLARILKECNVKPSIAALTLTSAAVDDVTAWILLAIVISIAKSGAFAGAALMIAMVIAFALVMVKVVPRLLARWSGSNLMPLLLLAASAGAAELIGVHAVFGAFVAGVVLPLDQERRRAYRRRLEPLALVFLPLFFAYSGLRTDLGLLVNASTLVACIGVVLIATAGKFGGGTIAARACGMPWYDALTIGTLMNTRGLMELVVLNLGYDLGIHNRDLFAIFVVMALVTTFATGPVLRLLRFLQTRTISQSEPRTETATR